METKQSGKQPAINVGDVVRYVPDAAHAREHDADRMYPWTFGFKQQRQVQKEHGRWGFEEYVEVLSDRRLIEVVRYLNNHPNRQEEEKKLFLLKPARTWLAKVVAVNNDGTVDLDIQSRWCDRLNHGSGVTLHYARVPVVETTKAAALMAAPFNANNSHPAASLSHTCHKA